MVHHYEDRIVENGKNSTIKTLWRIAKGQFDGSQFMGGFWELPGGG
jgi:hypothetical protein